MLKLIKKNIKFIHQRHRFLGTHHIKNYRFIHVTNLTIIYWTNQNGKVGVLEAGDQMIGIYVFV